MDGEQSTDSVALEELSAAERRFRALVRHSNECVMVVDEHLRVLQASDAVERIFGITAELAASVPIGTGMDEVNHRALMRAYEAVLAHPEALQRVEVRAPNAAGDLLWIEAVLSNQLHDPAVRGVVVNFWDITERRQLEDRLRTLAMHDPLTGLPNRALLFERLERAVDGLRGHGTRHSVGLLFIDLDHFKAVNDTLGHALGDGILKEVADRLAAVVRPGDTVARFGGDEFVVLCERLDDPGDAVVIAHRIDGALQRPLRVDEREFELGVSIGISYADPEAVDPLAVLQDADAAMYRAKSEGRGHWVIFDERLREEAARRQRTETALRATRDGQDLEVHYQPVVSHDTGRIAGVEALGEVSQIGAIDRRVLVDHRQGNGVEAGGQAGAVDPPDQFLQALRFLQRILKRAPVLLVEGAAAQFAPDPTEFDAVQLAVRVGGGGHGTAQQAGLIRTGACKIRGGAVVQLVAIAQMGVQDLPGQHLVQHGLVAEARLQRAGVRFGLAGGNGSGCLHGGRGRVRRAAEQALQKAGHPRIRHHAVVPPAVLPAAPPTPAGRCIAVSICVSRREKSTGLGW